MDSYHFHFERMSNLDLHPLSLPVSRLSPAKSSSSIDQYTHHHSKGDSAYSSFSGGSTVPDYPSPFLLDDLQSHSLQYTDLKYAKAKYSPTFLDSNSKSMDHIYRSMEAIEQQRPTVPTHLELPPPPPARLESLVTTKNLKNSRARQSPQGHLADTSVSQQTRKVEVCGVQAEPVCGYVFSQHFQRDQPNQGLTDKMVEPQEPSCVSNRLPLQTFQPEHVQQSRSDHSETQRRRSHSAYVRPVSEQKCYVNSCHMPQKSTSGSVHNKGQFYFVTGVLKSSESSVKQDVGDCASIEAPSEWSYIAQRRRQSCPDGPSGKLFFQEELKFNNQNDFVDPNNKAICPPYQSEQTSQGIEDQRITCKETERHHSSSHPIFYCGPEDSAVGKIMVPALIKEDHPGNPKKDEQMARILPQLDVQNDKISKETTPLLYHLTGANRASFISKLKNKNEAEMGIEVPDCDKDKQKAGNDGQISPSSEHQQSTISIEQQPDFPYICGTLDNSYKKYYKEKLKDAQSKVLRETSFKRRDLQLSLPLRIKQQTGKRLSVLPAGPLSQNMPSSLDNLTSHLHKLQMTEKENTRDLGQEIEKEIEKEKPQNIAQPQVPRVGSRKRLTADQKKLSHSEPEKLHQLADEPSHMTCRSLGNEVEGLVAEMDLSLVASRKKMFEIRGRAFSASNFSKPTLKHLQQKALVAYIERKTGQKVAEPQQPVLQVPGHRNSAAGRLSDSSSRNSKKLHRPLSAGRILDSVSSSVKYTQFLPVQPSSHSRQSSSREESHTAGKSASAEDLLDELKQPEIFRARSTSNPHAFQVRKHANDFSAISNKDISSAQRIAEGDTAVCHSHTVSEPDDRRPRKIAPRGKSMEELGVSKISKPEVFSKSSEQLDQLQGSASFLAAGTRAKMFNSGQHTDNSQTDAEKHISTFSVKHVSSHEGDIYIVPHSNGSKNRDDTVTPMSGHSGEADEINLEAGSKEQTSLQDVNKMSVSNQEVSFSHGITTDPNLWISTTDLNETKTDDQPSSATTVVKPQMTLPNSCSIREPISAEIQEAESIHEFTDNREQNGNEKKEDGPLGNGSMHEWELLVQEVVSADQSLACSFYPIANRKTALMLMEQLLSEDTLLMEEHYKKKQEQKVVCSEEAAHSTKAPVEDKPLDPSLDSGAALPNQKVCNIEMDITEKKRQLISHIEGHLTSLQELRSTLHSEDKENGRRGDVIETLVRESCMPAELERYTQFIGDLERVISLLLCLSARLARVQNALSTVDDSTDTEEKQSLDNRHRLLCKQRDDAKDLKDNLDRRERVVSAFLSKQLTDTQLQEYRRFVQTKASLLIRQKDLDEKQRLGEEQIEALLTSIPR